ncbi:uncharacterized protein RJT20DRAFT_29187 [Scheffersomyces xylosifermentans]|uniref:uncharacterized protein n=1 Tax=Scheffersomyces xylosifermentans TaxID=1304137 RepID=UPI00315D2227
MLKGRYCRYCLRQNKLRGSLLRVQSPRFYSSAENSGSKGEKDAPKEDQEDGNSALVERFSQILEEKMATGFTDSSIMNTDPTLQKIRQKYEKGLNTSKKDEQEQAFQEAMSYIKSEPLLVHNKHAKDIFEAPHWKGMESDIDANLRMIIDSKPKAIRTGPNVNKIFTPVPTFKEKVLNAKESSLDYKLNKEKMKNGESSESDNFRELYKERLLGPSMLINSASPTIDLVGSLASSKINASINQKTGQFDAPEMVHVRGKPLNSEHLKNCTDSNYFMNQVLNINEVLPPWIETQQTINSRTESLRKDLDEIWFKWIINKSPITSVVQASPSSVASIISAFEVRVRLARYDQYNLSPSEIAYLEERIKLLNDNIRNYNLQCPSSNLHKFKLLPENEIKNSYDRVVEKFPTTIVGWYDKHKVKKTSSSASEYKSSGGLLNLFGDDSKGGVAGSGSSAGGRIIEGDNKLHLWKALKDVFK